MAYDFTHTFRCNERDVIRFNKWCKKANKNPYDVLRELIEGVPEGRVTIKQDEDQGRLLRELYK